jgi:hypothetical protein
MNFYELSKEAREIQDRIEQMNANLEWLKADTEREFNRAAEQPKKQPLQTTQSNPQELTPDQIKKQFELRGEEFLNETIADLGKQFPSQQYDNQTQKLPTPPPPKNHEEMLKMFKKGDHIDGILLRFQGEK